MTKTEAEAWCDSQTITTKGETFKAQLAVQPTHTSRGIIRHAPNNTVKKQDMCYTGTFHNFVDFNGTYWLGYELQDGQWVRQSEYIMNHYTW